MIADEQLIALLSAAYQVVGAANAPVELLDNLSAVIHGKPLPHDSGAGLPWAPDLKLQSVPSKL